uniref:Dipeptidase n=1 Tax=Daphnia galeata TaxID=27404 RepID=A0A8J2R9K7_9CRUS|nr:unnamed protein product [Daphnia galeata]
MTPNCVSNKTQPCSSPGSFHGRSEFSSSLPSGYYGQNGGGTIPRNHRRQQTHQHYATAGIVESHFLSPSSQASGSASSSRRHLQHPLNGSASMVAEPGIDADDLMNEDSDSASQQSSRPAAEVGGKQWCILCMALLVALGTGVGVGLPLALRSGSSLQERLIAAQNILAQVPLIDGHNDMPWNIRKFAGGKLNTLRALETGLQHQDPWSKSAWSHTDLPRLREGRVGAQFWAAYVPCGAQYLDAVKQTLEQIDLIKRMVDRYSDYLRLAVDAKGIEESHQEGRIASLLGVEGGHSLGNSLGVLRTYYDLGIRYVTLTHTCNTPWADCSIAEADPHHQREGGLTHFGKLVIKEMNRLGVIVDLSHASSATMHHALDASRAPVIFSHSSTRALCNITRNVPDEVLKRLVTNGGIVMVSFFSLFVSCNKTSTIPDVVAHINHIRRVAGIDHVGIGAGYDGINTTPQGLEDVSKYPYLFAELLQDPTWTEEDLRKLAGLNFLRVFRQVEKVREDLRRANALADETSITNEELKGQLQCIYQERSAVQSIVT